MGLHSERDNLLQTGALADFTEFPSQKKLANNLEQETAVYKTTTLPFFKFVITAAMRPSLFIAIPLRRRKTLFIEDST